MSSTNDLIDVHTHLGERAVVLALSAAGAATKTAERW